MFENDFLIHYWFIITYSTLIRVSVFVCVCFRACTTIRVCVYFSLWNVAHTSAYLRARPIAMRHKTYRPTLNIYIIYQLHTGIGYYTTYSYSVCTLTTLVGVTFCLFVVRKNVLDITLNAAACAAAQCTYHRV